MVKAKQLDADLYRSELMDFLPDRIIDFHVHIWKKDFLQDRFDCPQRLPAWPMRVANENPAEDLKKNYAALFPGKEVLPLIFGYPVRDFNMDAGNRYVISSAAQEGWPALMMATPDMTVDALEQGVRQGAFCGVKVYLDLAPADIPVDKIAIFDFLPREMLEWLDKTGRIVMLHIPRSGRLRDPDNQKQLMEIDKQYPNAKVIVAHMGRAYSMEDAGDAFEVLSKSENLLFDFSANSSEPVFEQALETFGPNRILYGSDLPFTQMHSRRVVSGQGRYVNLVPKGVYPGADKDPYLQESDDPSLTFFLYEELMAFKRAASAAGIGPEDIRKIFCSNAEAILKDLWPRS